MRAPPSFPSLSLPLLLPLQIRWVLHGRILSNMSVVPFSQPEQHYVIRETVTAGERWSQLTVTHVTPADLTWYTCVAENVASLQEANVTLVPAAPTLTGAVTPQRTLDVWLLVGVAAGGVVLLLLLVTCICCCWRRRRRTKEKDQGHGHKNVLVVNPVEKPPRSYEPLAQTEETVSLEMVAATPSNHAMHKSFEELDYPESSSGASLSYRPLTGPGLPPLEEEGQDTTHDTTLETPLDFSQHYPDLLDMTRARAVSPTQLSYHSLMMPSQPMPLPPHHDWRLSYAAAAAAADPSNGASALQQHYAAIPYHQPPPPPAARPGYVTLPRRQRTPSWAGKPSSPPALLHVAAFDPVYDTVGPRTRADGTSRSDLTRPVREPFTPHTPSPASPLAGSLLHTHGHYIAPLQHPHHTPHHPHHMARNHQSATLPRSTPNLLDEALHETTAAPDPPALRDLQTSMPPAKAPAGTSLPPLAPLATHSPTLSSASTARTHSPFRASSPSSSASHASPSPALNGDNIPLLSDSTFDSSFNNNNNNNNKTLDTTINSVFSTNSSPPPAVPTTTSLKKVPPKPPPKPSIAKRLSVASLAAAASQDAANGRHSAGEIRAGN